MNKSEINTLLAEKLLGYTKPVVPFKYDSSLTHQDSSGGWYSIPDFFEDSEACLNLISLLNKDFKVIISCEYDEYDVKILNFSTCFLGEGFSLNEALINSCLELIKKGNYEST